MGSSRKIFQESVSGNVGQVIQSPGAVEMKIIGCQDGHKLKRIVLSGYGMYPYFFFFNNFYLYWKIMSYRTGILNYSS